MRQIIKHGAEIDAATPAEVAAIFAKQADRSVNQRYFRYREAMTLDSNGNGTHYARHVSGEYDWIMERISATATPAAAALLALYENEPDSSTLLEVIQLGTVGVYTDAFSNCIYLPSNSRLVLVCAGGTANGQCIFNLQIRMVKHS